MDLEAILKQLGERTGEILATQKGLREALDAHKGTTDTALSAIKGQYDAELKSLRDQYEALSKSISDSLAANRRPGAGVGATAQKSVGTLFAEHVAAQRKSGIEDPRQMQGLKLGAPITKAPIVFTGQSPIVDAMRVPGIQFQPRRQLRLRDLIPVLPTSSNAIEFVQETRFNQLAAKITSSASSGQKNIAVDNVNGFFAGQIITLSPGTGKEEEHVIASLTSPTDSSAAGTLTTTDNLTNTHAAFSSASSYDEGLVVSDRFIPTPETQIKPSAETKLEVVSTPVRTLAHTITISRQLFEDEAALGPHLDMQLTSGLAEEEESQILYGSGSGTQLSGIFANADVQTYAWSDGLVGDTEYDAIRRAMTFAAIANHRPDGVVLHPTKVERIQTMKGNDGHYVQVVQVVNGIAYAWGVPIIETTAIHADDGLVGSFGMACALFERMSAEISVGEQHADYFARNLLMIRGEQRVCFVLMRPESFVAIDFDEAPTPA